MAVAPRPWQVSPSRPQKSRPLKMVESKVRSLPARPEQPSTTPLVQTLRISKQVTQWVAIAAVTTAMGLYAGKAYYQKGWSEAFSHLLQLQDYEADLIATSASLGEFFQHQAEQPTAGLVAPTPAHSVYVKTPAQVSLPAAPQDTLPHVREQSPIGY
ncbi:hypothetical protein [Picosynechococcus sp. PCC 7117]|uniref:hypothetical protein n=1 Tax=Picosynechococcus sp. PCC 7117 TaxID=195498 RepID=UPI000810EFE7|nr:hypothetical protein [Picosynechococcus sp. PCC 7117]ANV88044.1 hypothetical protein AWQ22_11575 [Picosynechococcus sp. PCC 7117]